MFLTLPTILFYFLKDKVDTENYQLTSLAEKPNFSLQTISEFPTKYEDYYNDYLPFKNQILNCRGLFYLNILHSTSSSKHIILGKDNWLFYSNPTQPDNPIGDFRNFNYYSQSDSEFIKNKLLKTRDYLASKNTDFYILVLPNKENVYSDYMPKMIKQNSNRSLSKTEILLYKFKANTDLNIIYPKKELIDGRKICDTYYKNDTHWNNYGAYLGTIELMKKLDSNFYVEEPKISIGDESPYKDLARLNHLFYTSSPKIVIDNFYNTVTSTLIDEDGVNYKVYKSNGPYDKTMVLVGDSFGAVMIDYLSKLYTTFIYVNRNYCKPEMLEKYNPDIVVYECLERFSYELGNIDNPIVN